MKLLKVAWLSAMGVDIWDMSRWVSEELPHRCLLCNRRLLPYRDWPTVAYFVGKWEASHIKYVCLLHGGVKGRYVEDAITREQVWLLPETFLNKAKRLVTDIGHWVGVLWRFPRELVGIVRYESWMRRHAQKA